MIDKALSLIAHQCRRGIANRRQSIGAWSSIPACIARPSECGIAPNRIAETDLAILRRLITSFHPLNYDFRFFVRDVFDFDLPMDDRLLDFSQRITA
jgi:hypothetical protein